MPDVAIQDRVLFANITGAPSGGTQHPGRLRPAAAERINADAPGNRMKPAGHRPPIIMPAIAIRTGAAATEAILRRFTRNASHPPTPPGWRSGGRRRPRSRPATCGSEPRRSRQRKAASPHEPPIQPSLRSRNRAFMSDGDSAECTDQADPGKAQDPPARQASATRAGTDSGPAEVTPLRVMLGLAMQLRDEDPVRYMARPLITHEPVPARALGGRAGMPRASK